MEKGCSESMSEADKLHWTRLLSPRRICTSADGYSADPTRDEFHIDYDRIVYSSDFRRLKDKTQVFPLSRNDFTRSRLTHSLEVSCVGRTLGRKLAELLTRKGLLPDTESDIGTIVAAASLAHDIGNPPFGHSGESAIQTWAKKNTACAANNPDHRPFEVATEQELLDLHRFEGNAQGLRVLARLQANRRKGGLRMTVATLAAMMKYPCSSSLSAESKAAAKQAGCKPPAERKKFGYFSDDAETIVPELREIGMEETEPGGFRRHPLAYLVEAADDICYAVIDLEDAVDQRCISHAEAVNALLPIARLVVPDFAPSDPANTPLGWVRAIAIGGLVHACMTIIESRFDEFTAGTLPKSLIELSTIADQYKEAYDLVVNFAYRNRRVLEVEAAGYKVIGGLLDLFVPALVNDHDRGADQWKLLSLFPERFLRESVSSRPLSPDAAQQALTPLSTYQRILAATDFISGMTDSYAVDMYQKLSGIKLPE
ncbi:dGTP triphosphohydrolase [Aeoliella mucimassa]|uniref:Deoxyguanosinetriphosphate triphosphohydrolase n=1 Tax=Aeoliella mucimassa TaxID=2527972 RepID=A0A518AHI8_9BACT|nr:dNTP triphosphohydrolase [Aeoliella mucimassa]QDU54203.1 Deoxyguanosinetriphosphate triphosphohydrolase [Aeoliella mucimassa]